MSAPPSDRLEPIDYFTPIERPVTPPAPEPELVLGVGLYGFYRIIAATGEVITNLPFNDVPSGARSYLSSGPGGDQTEFYVNAEIMFPGEGVELIKILDEEVVWRVPSVDDGYPLLVPFSDGSALVVNFEMFGRLELLDPETGAMLSAFTLAGAVRTTREVRLAPEEDSVFLITPTSSPFPRLLRVALDGTVIWATNVSAFSNEDHVFAVHDDGTYLYTKDPGTTVRRFNMETGAHDSAWDYVQSGQYAIPDVGRGPSAGKLFVGNTDKVRCLDIATKAVLWDTEVLYGQIHYLISGPDGEVYAGTKTTALQDQNMRIYRIDPDGSVAWETVLDRAHTTTNNVAGMRLSMGITEEPVEPEGSGVIDFFTGEEV